MTRPRVSVMIPAFQSESRIGRTLARLRQQTFADFEVVVVNDGSTDRTSQRRAQAMAEDARVRLVEQPNGASPRRETAAIEHARARSWHSSTTTISGIARSSSCRSRAWTPCLARRS